MFRKFGSISYTLERLKGAEKGHPEEHECVRNGQGFEVRKSAVRPECNEGRNKVPWGCRLCRPQRCEAHFASPPLMPFFYYLLSNFDTALLLREMWLLIRGISGSKPERKPWVSETLFGTKGYDPR